MKTSRDVPLMKFAAGATTGLNCSLCQAGTYGTGSGLNHKNSCFDKVDIAFVKLFNPYTFL